MTLYLRNVYKSYSSRENRRGADRNFGLKGIDFELKKGLVTLITGDSGSGKSTMLNILCGLLKPDSGEVLHGPEAIYDKNERNLALLRNQTFGIIPQKSLAVSSLTVAENVKLPTLYSSADDVRLSEKCSELLEALNLSAVMDSYPRQLSGGEMRRMCIARALINEPEYVFADEPTNDLDGKNIKQVLSLLRKTAERGAGVLIVSHDQTVKEYADITYVMSDGVPEKGEVPCPFATDIHPRGLTR